MKCLQVIGKVCTKTCTITIHNIQNSQSMKRARAKAIILLMVNEAYRPLTTTYEYTFWCTTYPKHFTRLSLCLVLPPTIATPNNNLLNNNFDFKEQSLAHESSTVCSLFNAQQNHMYMYLKVIAI